MFIGGSDPERSSSLSVRPPSFKGVMRFWWRAINWHRFYKSNGDHPVRTLKALHKAESKLFGSATEDGKGGQGRFLLRIPAPSAPKRFKAHGKADPGIAYLLGMGLHHYRKGYTREAIAAGQDFEIELLLKNAEHPSNIELAETLVFMGMLGGLGSRSRRGLGSIAIQQISSDADIGIEAPSGVDAMQSLIKDKLNSLPNKLPPITAFSKKSKIECSIKAQGNDPMQLLDKVGREFCLYRAWGRHGKVMGQKSEKNFKDDHGNIKSFLQGGKLKGIPERSVFGLPHNYFFSSIKKGPSKADVSNSASERERRASPLLIHLHRFPNGEVAAIQSMIPSMFLPKGDEIEVSIPRARMRKSFKPDVNWSVIEQYLDRDAFAQGRRLL